MDMILETATKNAAVEQAYADSLLDQMKSGDSIFVPEDEKTGSRIQEILTLAKQSGFEGAIKITIGGTYSVVVHPIAKE